ncbi:ACP S-malonyltransferase [Sphingomonas donggukensis]|uniref:[acyl-carrier-protein] S-malonyltransferase n=1 Tax=Sphingomonas donggukensis TaxID=2949093 RepID=A0ABY4TRA4_9SPHN|nr:ACP S-malonyltransferase [Sphingomonas donggukensis]URW74924.1 ACP S-malonyltransferase [Sphingomonas donggukensis]
MSRQTALVVCPGRGSYGKAELGSLARADLSAYDAIRTAAGKPTLTALDSAERFSPSIHLAGENAAPLIYAASMADMAAIDRDRFDVVAVTGNSMGWYTALAAAGAVERLDGFRIADAMGVNSGRHGAGGQLIASTLDGEWRAVPGLRARLLRLAADTGLAVSIDLGGTLVLAGDDAALKAFASAAPVDTVRLAGNGPFHTALMHASSTAALATLPADWFGNPDVPMIDGRGHIWRRWASGREALWRYTFAHQILEAYDFALAIRVALREFAPDRIILLGPGDQLGGAIGQILVGMGWLGMTDKAGFAARQADDPFLLAMGRADQRNLVTK